MRIPIQILLVGALVLAVLAIRLLLQPPLPRYPEFRSVTETEKETIRAAFSFEEKRLTFQSTKTAEQLAASLDRYRPIAVLAAYQDAFDRLKGSSVKEMSATLLDHERMPIGTWLSSKRDSNLNAVLLRILTNEDEAFPIRDSAAVALCWEGNESVLKDLSDFVLDMNASPEVRTRVLGRLHRIRIRPPKAFDALLQLPFRNHDFYAAAILAVVGASQAPRLVAEGLRHVGSDNDLGHLLALASEAIAADDTRVVALARIAQQRVVDAWLARDLGDEPLPTFPMEALSGADVPEDVLARLEDRTYSSRDALHALGVVFTQWIRDHPQVLDSDFERRWTRHTRSDSYELARKTLKDSLEGPVRYEPFDLAAAHIASVTNHENHCLRVLNAFDRLAQLLAQDIEGLREPNVILRQMHRRLLPQRIRYRSGYETSPSSFLYNVLHDRTGNCVGLTSLYVALGQRLGIPLVAVSSPRHVHLRWKDAHTTLDIELTDRGRILDPSELSGKPMRELSMRALVSIALSNRSMSYALSERLADTPMRRRIAKASALRAQAWDPKQGGGYLAHAICETIEKNHERAIECVEHAMALMPNEAEPLGAMGQVLLERGDIKDAQAWFERALRIDPENEVAKRGIELCRSRAQSGPR